VCIWTLANPTAINWFDFSLDPQAQKRATVKTVLDQLVDRRRLAGYRLIPQIIAGPAFEAGFRCLGQRSTTAPMV
jgi:hypothetical protein